MKRRDTKSLRNTFVLPCVAASFLLVAACSSSSDEETYVERPAEDFYSMGLNALSDNNYDAAVRNFDEVERQHPYSSWAPRAQLMAAYAHYREQDYDDAILALDRFIQLNPGHPNIDYAYYMKAICYYEQISDVERDQSMTRQAMESLETVINRFPDSAYARDAELKHDLAVDHLAGKHMSIGRYYLRRGEYLAAINRFQTVVRDYQTTSHVPEALHRLVESYLALGVYDEAQSTAAVLGYNYPGSEWYIDSYALLTGEDLRPERREGSWISGVWDSVF
ncbi:outer membrane protein assembly factor BamD [Fodinicurvata fenggangensis]|uniref:outer membrane protein assembly factor BamD n=1 Tax=Fodinicurvata fenggangensis TaxID=1121830 RepID=UPI0006909128|nr:outer membrane protein assembly factor BamD [Fodinicurvata fenggangensis]